MDDTDIEFEPGPWGYRAQAAHTFRNIVGYALRRKLHLEGRHDGTTWHNWTFGERNPEATFLQPDDEAGIIEAITGHESVRVVGSGHSFNAAIRADVQLSLDRYAGVIEEFDHSHLGEPPKGTTYVRVKAGMRVRDINAYLAKHERAIVALPSHDSQSMAGVLSTDVHGTGRDVGFVSASVVGLRVIDGTGKVHDTWTGEPLFQAAIGGIGAVGVITQVSIRTVEAFRIRQQTKRIELADARRDCEDLLKEHAHVNFYVFPFARYTQLHLWDRVEDPKSRFGDLREFLHLAQTALTASWVGDALAKAKLLPKVIDWSLHLQPGSDLVLDSAQAFNRTIYHMHQEIEFAVHRERTWEVVDRLCTIYTELFGDHRMPFTLIEVRFTPHQGTESMISPASGAGPHVWFTIACSQSGAVAEYFAAIEQYMREIGGKPHLGKWCETLTDADMRAMHGAAFEQFQQLRKLHDPNGRFANRFTERVLGPIEP
ncbi:MAG: D-arabinono-1,4-lactone oxidase [Actinomycetota bacterium]